MSAVRNAVGRALLWFIRGARPDFARSPVQISVDFTPVPERSGKSDWDWLTRLDEPNATPANGFVLPGETFEDEWERRFIVNHRACAYLVRELSRPPPWLCAGREPE